jgi:hypothetical protein
MAEIEYITDDENVSGECLHFCAPGSPAACDKSWCECDCHRAAELDDRPADKLAVVAAELQAERDGDVRDLVAERFGQPRRGAA